MARIALQATRNIGAPMPATRETVLAALHARLQPLAALTLRDEVLPERIPAAGLIILRDGQPGEPEVTSRPCATTISTGPSWRSSFRRALAGPAPSMS